MNGTTTEQVEDPDASSSESSECLEGPSNGKQEEDAEEDPSGGRASNASNSSEVVVIPETPENKKRKRRRVQVQYFDSDSDDKGSDKEEKPSDDDSAYEERTAKARRGPFDLFAVSGVSVKPEPKSRRKRNDEIGNLAFADDSEHSSREGPSIPVAKKVSKYFALMTDEEQEEETNRLRLKKGLEVMKKQFPSVDEDDLKSILTFSAFDLTKAAQVVRSKFGGSIRTNGPSKDLGHGSGWIKVEKNYDIKIISRPKGRALILSDSDSDVEVINGNDKPATNGVTNGRKKLFKSKRKLVTIGSDESEEEEVLPESGDEQEEYEKDELVYFSSDDEDEEEDDDGISYGQKRKTKKKKKEDNKENNKGPKSLKSKVLFFLQEGLSSELLAISGVSKKKADTIIEMRPFTDWADLVDKVKNSKLLSTELLNNSIQVIKSRDCVLKLLKDCEDISNSIGNTVKTLKPATQPKNITPTCKLADYQLIGLNWLVLMYKKSINGILADEMGLGKTIQVIALLSYLRDSYKVNGPHLIIVPASTLDNWGREFETWCKDIDVRMYHGSQEDRTRMRIQIMKYKKGFDVMLTTYAMVASPEDKALFKSIKFVYVVFDEAHMLKNMNTGRYQNLMNTVRADHRLLLTGTPLQNNLLELMSLLIFTVPDIFRGRASHVQALFTKHRTEDDGGRATFERERIEQAKKIMSPFVLRRLKKDVLKQLPTKHMEVIECKMTPYQQKQYIDLIGKYTREINKSGDAFLKNFEIKDDVKTLKGGAGMLMGLRRAANHPLLLRTYYTDEKLHKMSKLLLKEPTHHEANPQYIFEDMQILYDYEIHAVCQKYASLKPFQLSEDQILASGKFIVLDEMLPKLKAERKRVLIFSQFVMVLDIMEWYLKIRGHHYARLDGSTKVTDRLDLIDDFNDDPELFIFLLSTKAGGLGINLTSANVVFIHDIDFNPYNDKQAEDRCHRVGQTKEVTIYRLISQSSVEEGMLEVAEEKLKLGEDICDKYEKSGKKEDQKDMKTLLRQALGM